MEMGLYTNNCPAHDRGTIIGLSHTLQILKAIWHQHLLYCFRLCIKTIQLFWLQETFLNAGIGNRVIFVGPPKVFSRNSAI